MFINEFDVFVGKHQAIPSLDQSTEQLHLMVECFLLVKAESVGFVAAEGLDQLDCIWMDDSKSVRLIQTGLRLLLHQVLPPHELKQVKTKGFVEFLMQALNISKRIPENISSFLLQSS